MSSNSDYLDTESESADPGKLQSLSSQIAFGPDTLRPSISFDCLGTVYDQHFSTRLSHSHKVPVEKEGGALDVFLFPKICWYISIWYVRCVRTCLGKDSVIPFRH